MPSPRAPAGGGVVGPGAASVGPGAGSACPGAASAGREVGLTGACSGTVSELADVAGGARATEASVLPGAARLAGAVGIAAVVGFAAAWSLVGLEVGPASRT